MDLLSYWHPVFCGLARITSETAGIARLSDLFGDLLRFDGGRCYRQLRPPWGVLPDPPTLGRSCVSSR